MQETLPRFTHIVPMIANPFLKLSLRGSTAHAIFTSVDGLEPNATESLILIFDKGQVFGLDFIKYLSNPSGVMDCRMELELWSGLIKLQSWVLHELSIGNYRLNQNQTTEEYLILEVLELRCKML